MKTADKKTLQTKEVKELQKLIEETRKTLNQVKLDHAQGKLKNTRSIFNIRKEVAVMQSVLQTKLVKKEENK
ncbi:MAG TPA: 50S ribosomal protein L29 [Candidatus Sulfotelmatobacter sp.]|jgi:ribosomal protein L29|nr:50S ribosomal protein L29 [Candidatus Sulfotelmatobacter sp.]